MKFNMTKCDLFFNLTLLCHMTKFSHDNYSWAMELKWIFWKFQLMRYRKSPKQHKILRFWNVRPKWSISTFRGHTVFFLREKIQGRAKKILTNGFFPTILQSSHEEKDILCNKIIYIIWSFRVILQKKILFFGVET